MVFVVMRLRRFQSRLSVSPRARSTSFGLHLRHCSARGRHTITEHRVLDLSRACTGEWRETTNDPFIAPLHRKYEAKTTKNGTGYINDWSCYAQAFVINFALAYGDTGSS